MARIKNRVRSVDACYRERLTASSQLGERRDCSVIAISIATDTPYEKVHAMLQAEGRRKGSGTYPRQSEAVIKALGYRIEKIKPQDLVAQYGGNRVRNVTTFHPRSPEFAWFWKRYAADTLIMRTMNHMLCVKHGVVQDWSTNRALRVVGIWRITK